MFKICDALRCESDWFGRKVSDQLGKPFPQFGTQRVPNWTGALVGLAFNAGVGLAFKNLRPASKTLRVFIHSIWQLHELLASQLGKRACWREVHSFIVVKTAGF